MFPYLFKLGPLTVYSFGLMVALAFLSGFYAIVYFEKHVKRPVLTDDNISRLFLFLMCGGALGARAAYVIEHWNTEFCNQSFFYLFRFDKGGLMFYGGLIGAIISIFCFSMIKKIAFFALLDICAAVLPLGHAFGRIGCFLNGCCFGRPCDCAISVSYPPESLAFSEQVRDGLISRSASGTLPVLPSQLIEAGANFLLFTILYRFALKKQPRTGIIASTYMIAYAIIRFCTEFMRSDPRLFVLGFSIGQIISATLLIAGVILLSWALKRDSKSEK